MRCACRRTAGSVMGSITTTIKKGTIESAREMMSHCFHIELAGFVYNAPVINY